MSFLRKAQQHVAHTSKLPALGNQDLRQLQDVITSEKNFIQSNTKAATDFKKNAESIKAWSAEEGPDLNDVVGKVSLLYDHYAASQNRLNSHLSTVRLHFKSIRTREEALADLKSRKRSLGSDIEKVEKKLAKMGPENKELMKVTAQLKEMRGEMEGLHIEVINEEAAIGDFKRRTAREALGIKSGALLEMAEKLTIVAEISKLMLEEIPLQATQPGMPRAEYYGFAKTESLLQEATRCIADVGFTPNGPSAGIPRFGDMTLADTTANGSRDMSHSFANPDGEVYHDMPSHGSGGDVNPDTGYSPSVGRVLSTEDVARTPIYAQHASRSQWAQDSPAGEPHMSDPATNEWAQSSYERGDTSTASAAAAAALAATAGADLNAVPGHGDPNQPDGGFLMQNSASYTGSAGVGSGPQYGSNRNSADYQSAQGGHANEHTAPAGLAARATSTEGHQSDAYDGYTASGASQGQHHETAANPTAMLGAPTLPPLRTATPLNGSTSTAQAAVASPQTYTATDDSAYFQSIGSTRAMQEAVRRPTSPNQNASRMSSYGALGAGSTPQPSGGEGKKVTAAAFRRGFSRNPSSQANLTTTIPSNSYDAPDQGWNNNPLPQPPNLHANLSTPTPPGGYNGTTPDSEHIVPPLHIQKRNSNSHANPLGAAAAAGTPADMQGRRYSNDLNVSGSDNPAPPYLPDQHHDHQQQGVNSVDYAQHQPNFPPPHHQIPPPGPQRQHSSQYAEYAAPPPPGYGYA
ncbi:related to LSP1 - primary component of eisosomes [Ustilago trichophora]|uniref:Related to LSP1 - primary component of eisosomes n=1 Tax=Ustilago trichophora TaxID=86804 RepID=A0A5C3EIL1_9BASI|nr:related to LSP1 - primary component of eisosomes [Ustilago trichophora]